MLVVVDPAITVYRLFQTRAELCRTVYTHAKVKVGWSFFHIKTLSELAEKVGLLDKRRIVLIVHPVSSASKSHTRQLNVFGLEERWKRMNLETYPVMLRF